MLVGTAVALVAAGLAPTFGLFLVASVAVGMTSSVTQILVPVAARLAPPGTRGRFIGRVMSGLLLGILLARTVSSLLADAIGWRSVYLISAGVMLVLAPCLRMVLPPLPPAHATTYRALMRSLAADRRGGADPAPPGHQPGPPLRHVHDVLDRHRVRADR